jgi:alpha-beta hydrolase superfamily lysophospholipase
MYILKNSFFIIFLLLTSCGVFIRQPGYVKSIEPCEGLTGNDFIYSDGSRNFVKQSIFDSSSVIIICVPGLGGHAGSYNLLQEEFTGRKISTVIIDLRGFGHWPGEIGDIRNIGLQIGDLNQIVDYYRNRYPYKKILLLGESLGTSLSLWYCSFYPSKIDGLILTSLLTGRGMSEIKFRTIIDLSIGYILLGFEPDVYSNDPEYRKWEQDYDTLAGHKISSRYLIQSNRVIKESYKSLYTFKKPAIVLQGGKDFLSDKKGMEKILGKCMPGKIQYEYFPDHYHSLVNDKNRKDVFRAMIEWINKYY